MERIKGVSGEWQVGESEIHYLLVLPLVRDFILSMGILAARDLKGILSKVI